MYLGDVALAALVSCRFNTSDPTGAPITLAGTPGAQVRRSDGTVITAGVTLTVDVVTGQHLIAVDTSASASYTAGHDYSVELSAGTVSGVSVVGKIMGTFSLVNRLQTGDAFARLGAPAGASIAADIAALSTTLAGLAAAAATAVWSAATRLLTAGTNIVLAKGTGLTGLNDLAATAIVSGGAITTSGGKVSEVALVDTLTTYTGNTPQTGDAFARLGAPAGASIAADIAGIPALVWAVSVRTLSSVGTLVSDIWAAVVDSAGVTTLLARLTSGRAANLDDLDATVSSRLAASSYAAPLDAAGTRAAVGLAGATLDTQLAGLDSDVLAVGSAAAAAAASSASAAATSSTVNTKIGTPASTVSGDLAAVAAQTGNLPADPASQAAVIAAVPTATANADALLDRTDAIETGVTLRGAHRLGLAALAGKASGGGTATMTYRNVGDTTDRIVATCDPTGNRSAVTTDVS